MRNAIIGHGQGDLASFAKITGAAGGLLVGLSNSGSQKSARCLLEQTAAPKRQISIFRNRAKCGIFGEQQKSGALQRRGRQENLLRLLCAV